MLTCRVLRDQAFNQRRIVAGELLEQSIIILILIPGNQKENVIRKDTLTMLHTRQAPHVLYGTMQQRIAFVISVVMIDRLEFCEIKITQVIFFVSAQVRK